MAPRHDARPRGAVLAPLVLVALVGASCKTSSQKEHPSPGASSTRALSTVTPAGLAPSGDPLHGKTLLAEYQCNRCHTGAAMEAPPQNKQCVQCHTDIVEGRFNASAALLVRWKPIVADLTDAPSLEAMGKRFRRGWVEQYLQRPYDVRPNLSPSMPRLPISPSQAKDIAAYLVPEENGTLEARAEGDLEKGRKVLESKGCIACHAMSGVPGLQASPLPVALEPKEFARARRLAPDLRHTRMRSTPAQTVAWLREPRALKSDASMPKIPLSEEEIRDVVAFLHNREFETTPAPAAVVRLPLLSRKVTFAEVDKKVFHRTCWHCHSEPDYAIGDGGPGNSGGFGFKPRGLNLSDYNGIAAGYIDDKGVRASVFAAGADGVPRMVAALLARHTEEGGAETGGVRGMPLGYAPVALEDIQLVDTWIAQGRPR